MYEPLPHPIRSVSPEDVRLEPDEASRCGRSAGPATSRGRSLLGSLCLALVPLMPLAACGADAGKKSSGPSGAAGSPRVAVIDLIAALTPLDPTIGAGDKHDWFTRRRATLERLRSAGHDVGIEALRVYHEREAAHVDIRSGLLDVAAHTAPVETVDLLVELTTTFGPDMGLRTTAAGLLGEAAPAKAIEVLEPILRRERSGVTYPPEDRLLESWFEAATILGLDPVPLLCTIATDLTRDHSPRSYATKRLGEIPSTQGRQALEQLLLESSGNHMIRRYAAQALQNSVDSEEFCNLIRRTLDREADLAFQTFLDHMLVTYCP